MADFFTDLWTSIFTPGPTPTLVVATNVSFAVLQLLLLTLLIATYSVHFVILSALCGGLWWSINWFVREINILKEAERRKAADEAAAATASSGRPADASAAESEDTETEELVSKPKGLRHRPAATRVEETELSASTSALSVHSIESRQASSTGNVSGTDSEWDKLDSEAE